MPDIEYVLRLVAREPCNPDEVSGMMDRDAKRRLERTVLQRLRTLDGDWDVEVMEVKEVPSA